MFGHSERQDGISAPIVRPCLRFLRMPLYIYRLILSPRLKGILFDLRNACRDRDRSQGVTARKYPIANGCQPVGEFDQI